MTICPKCNYQRKTEDVSPDYECPRCGIIYSKYRRTEESFKSGNEINSPLEIKKDKGIFSFPYTLILCGLIVSGIVYFMYTGAPDKDLMDNSNFIQEVFTDKNENIDSYDSNSGFGEMGGDYSLDSRSLKKMLHISGLSILDGSYSGLSLEDYFYETGIRFVVPTEPVSFRKYKCDPPDESELFSYTAETMRLLSDYPIKFLQKSNLKFIMLCGHLYAENIRPGGIPNAVSGILVMDIAYNSSVDKYIENFHHELYHMVDFSDNHSFVDSNWETLNAAEFKYGKHGKFYRNASSKAGSGEEGFITEYAMSAIEEDKAEIFRFLMYDRGTIETMAQDDPILNEKVKQLKDSLIRFCPEMEDLF